jgi:putative phosphoribosyl transferase
MSGVTRFRNRTEAGELLAELLSAYAGRDDVVVLALPRGGVPVGFAVTEALNVPLDIRLVRKLGVPGQEELAMGAIASGDVCIVQSSIIDALGIPPEAIEAVAQRESREIERREKLYRADRPPVSVQGCVAILVDDGLATGSTMRAAVHALRHENPEKIVIAVPLASRQACRDLEQEVDEIVCLSTPEPFYAVGIWYEDFRQTTDDEVRDLLEKSRHPSAEHTLPDAGRHEKGRGLNHARK